MKTGTLCTLFLAKKKRYIEKYPYKMQENQDLF